MSNLDLKLEGIIQDELVKIQKKRPFVENIEVSYEHNEKGIFMSKLKAKTRKKSVILSQEGRCAESAIKKLFTNLKRKLGKRAFIKPKRFIMNLEEAA